MADINLRPLNFCLLVSSFTPGLFELESFAMMDLGPLERAERTECHEVHGLTGWRVS